METKEFKKMIDSIARSHGFQSAYGGWFKEGPECIFVLNLQRSSYSNFYYLYAKIYIQGCFGSQYAKSRGLVSRDIGDIFTDEPSEYKDIFNLEHPMTDAERRQKMEAFFEKHLVPFSDAAMTRTGIRSLNDNHLFYLLPAVKLELERLGW